MIRSRNPLELMVRRFHKIFGHPVAENPTLVEEKTSALRAALIQEELNEYLEATEAKDLQGVADAIGDMLYVVIGTAVVHGVNIDPLVQEVHSSNMSKLQNGKPLYAPNGKVIKGEDFREPDILQVLTDQGWTP